MKKIIEKHKISISIIFVSCILIGLIFIPKFKQENLVIFSGITYGNLQDLKHLNLKYDYEVKSFFDDVNYTLYSDYVSLKLVSASNFNDFVYLDGDGEYGREYSKVLLASGEFPKNDNEVILQNGLSEFHKIGDTIMLNLGDIYGDTNDESNVKVIGSLNGYVKNSLRYDSEDNLKEYKIVGFYTWESDDYVRDLVNGNITFINQENGWDFHESVVFTKIEKNYYMHEKTNAIVTYKSFKKDTTKNKDFGVIGHAFKDYVKCDRDFPSDYCSEDVDFIIREYDSSRYDN